MMWPRAGGIGVLCVVAAVCVWTVIVLLAEAGDGQDAAADDPGTDGAYEPDRAHEPDGAHEPDRAHEPDSEPRLESAMKRKRVRSSADRY